MRVAIVEDSEQFKFFLNMIFQEQNWEPIFFSSGEDFDSESFDVIIIDYRLPGEDGEIVLAYIEKNCKRPHYAIMAADSEMIGPDKIQPALYCNLFEKEDIKTMIQWLQGIDNRLKVRELMEETRVLLESTQRMLPRIYLNLN